MATCPQGHTSADEEFCDVCGREIGGAPAAAAVPDAPAAAEPDLTAAGAECKVCGAELAGRFCEACGHDSMAAVPVTAAPAPPVPADRLPEETTWTATVTADRAYYDSVMAVDGPDAAGIAFPPYCPDRHFPLAGKQVSIGRQSRSRGIQPDIDLIGPPEDPGVSHLHAVLLAGDDGTWSIVDLDSANGTVLNDEQNPLRPNTPRQLAEGDRVYIGAWTRITLRRA
ncbi:FHA domain-containing protein [Actinophytocola sp. KF-1]